jgi:hypothetical protein
MDKIIKTFLFVLLLPVAAMAGTTTVTPPTGENTYELSVDNEIYILQANVTVNGTAFAVTCSDCELRSDPDDTTIYTVTYDNADSVRYPNFDFEIEDSGDATLPESWDCTDTDSVSRASGTFIPRQVFSGSYSLRVGLPCDSQHIVSEDSVIFNASTTYYLSLMAAYPSSASDAGYTNVKIGIGFVGTDSMHIQTGYTYRPFEHEYMTYTTGASPETLKVWIAVWDATGVTATPIYIDYVLAGRFRVDGISISPNNYNLGFPNITPRGGAPNFRVSNVKFVQGKGRGMLSHGISCGEDGNNNLQIDSCESYVWGPSSQAINNGARFATWGYANGHKIFDNVCKSEVIIVSSRDNDLGVVLRGGQGDGFEITGNDIHGGPQGGIACDGSNPANPAIVRNNTITGLTGLFTNNFAIKLIGDDGSLVDSNEVYLTATDSAGRGIGLFGCDGTIIRHNTVRVQSVGKNQEYDGCAPYGCYVLQMEDATNCIVDSNVFVGIANLCNNFTIRIGGGDEIPIGTGNIFRDNFCTTFVSSGKFGATVAMQQIQDSTRVDFSGNTFTSEMSWVHFTETDQSGVIFTGNKWAIGATPLSPQYPFTMHNYSYISGWQTHFRDNTWGTGAEALFEGESFRNFITWAVHDSADYFYEWSVTVRSQEGDSVYTINTDDDTTHAVLIGASDSVVLFVAEYYDSSSTVDNFNDWTTVCRRGGQEWDSTATVTEAQIYDPSFAAGDPKTGIRRRRSVTSTGM